MNKYEFFIKAMKAKAHYEREWVLRAFTVVLNPPKEQLWAIKQTKENVMVFVPHEEGARWEVLDGCKGYEIPYIYHDATGPVKAGDVENLKKDLVNSTYGELFTNSRVLVYAADDTIPFMEGKIHPERLEEYVVANLVSNPINKEDKVPGTFYVDNHLRLGKAVADMCGFDIFIPSIGIKALQAPPNNEELKAQLLEQYKDSLDDPVSQTKIEDELVENYKNFYKGDPSEGLFIKGKTVTTALKRMYLIHGPEAGFTQGGRAKLITTTLDQGLNLDYFPDMVNSLRGGSYSRGALTALAGTDVDLIGRNSQNARILPTFCGTTGTVSTRVNKKHLLRWFLEAGNRIQMTEEVLKEKLGQVVEMYDPTYCIAGAEEGSNDVCAYCIGGKMARYPTSLGSNTQERLAYMMSAMMATAHAKKLKTTPLDLSRFLD